MSTAGVVRASRGERLATLGGAAFAVLVLGGLFLQATAAGGAEEESRAEVVARYSDGGNELRAELGTLLVGLAIAVWLPFVVTLRATLSRVEDEPAVFATAALAGGTMMAALLALAAIANAAAFSSYDFYDAYETDASTVLLFQSVSFYALGFALVGGGVFVASTSLVALRTRLLPTWLAIVGLVLGTVLLLGEWALFFTFPILALAVWLAVVSVLLAVHEHRAQLAAAGPVTAP